MSHLSFGKLSAVSTDGFNTNGNSSTIVLELLALLDFVKETYTKNITSFQMMIHMK